MKFSIRNLTVTFLYAIGAPMLAFGLSYVTALLPVKVSESQAATVGITTYYGWPVWFFESAPGISIMHGWHLQRFVVNGLVWLVMLEAVIFGLRSLVVRHKMGGRV